MSDCGVEGDEVTGTQLSHLLDSTRVFKFLPMSYVALTAQTSISALAPKSIPFFAMQNRPGRWNHFTPSM